VLKERDYTSTLIESLSAQVKQCPIFLNVMSIVDNGTPRSYEEAIRSSKADQWKKATDDEYTAIVNNNTYRLVPLPKDRKSVTTKWIYKIKYSATQCGSHEQIQVQCPLGV